MPLYRATGNHNLETNQYKGIAFLLIYIKASEALGESN